MARDRATGGRRVTVVRYESGKKSVMSRSSSRAQNSSWGPGLGFALLGLVLVVAIFALQESAHEGDALNAAEKVAEATARAAIEKERADREAVNAAAASVAAKAARVESDKAAAAAAKSKASELAAKRSDPKGVSSTVRPELALATAVWEQGVAYWSELPWHMRAFSMGLILVQMLMVLLAKSKEANSEKTDPQPTHSSERQQPVSQKNDKTNGVGNHTASEVKGENQPKLCSPRTAKTQPVKKPEPAKQAEPVGAAGSVAVEGKAAVAAGVQAEVEADLAPFPVTRDSSPAWKVFKAVDANEDGWLSSAELKSFVETRPEELTQLVGGKFDWKGMVDQIEQDVFHKLDVAEFVRFYEAILLFQLTDLDGDGSITKREMTQWVQEHQDTVRRHEQHVGQHAWDFQGFWTGMLSFDTNLDGQLQLREFVHWYAYGNDDDSEIANIMAQQDKNAARSSPGSEAS